MISEAFVSAAEESIKSRSRKQYVFEASWEIIVEDKPTLVSQLFSGKDFQAAFFKARKWAQGNAYGELVSMLRRADVVI